METPRSSAYESGPDRASAASVCHTASVPPVRAREADHRSRFLSLCGFMRRLTAEAALAGGHPWLAQGWLARGPSAGRVMIARTRLAALIGGPLMSRQPQQPPGEVERSTPSWHRPFSACPSESGVCRSSWRACPWPWYARARFHEKDRPGIPRFFLPMDDLPSTLPHSTAKTTTTTSSIVPQDPLRHPLCAVSCPVADAA